MTAASARGRQPARQHGPCANAAGHPGPGWPSEPGPL